eukprot:gene16329-19424_t
MYSFQFDLHAALQVLAQSLLSSESDDSSLMSVDGNEQQQVGSEAFNTLRGMFKRSSTAYTEADRTFIIDELARVLLQHPLHTRTIARDEREDRWLPLVQTAYRLLSFDAKVFGALWNWAPFYALVEIESASIRWYVIKSMAMVLRIPDTKLESLRPYYSQFYHQISQVEEDIVCLEQSLLFLNNNNDLHMIQDVVVDLEAENGNQELVSRSCVVRASDLNQAIVDVCGVLLFKKPAPSGHHQQNTQQQQQQQLVYTPTVNQNVQSVAMAIGLGKPILMEGVTGAGKTTLVGELAALTGNSQTLIKIHLGDQTDAKVLLGTYVTSDVPGEFRWQAGALTQAVAQGRWILIEDIDLAPLEVLSVLIPLLESRTLFIPGRGDTIEAAPGFQLFATQTLFGAGGHSRDAHASVLAHLWTRVVIEALSPREMTQVLHTLFPELRPLVPKFIETFNLLTRVINGQSIAGDLDALNLANDKIIVSSSRLLSSRDLLKWIKRSNARLACTKISHASAVAEIVFVEALDCFCSMIGKRTVRARLVEVIGRCWELGADRILHFAERYKPTILNNASGLSVGRGHLLPAEKSDAVQSVNRKATVGTNSGSGNFAHTTNALRLIESVSIAIQFNEPILLVGETGTGKTSVIQYVADQLNQRLVVLNLNQQSDSADLVGGFKPVEMRLLCTPLKAKFETLFGRTFSDSANSEFLERIATSYAARNWRSFVTLLGKAIRLVDRKVAAGGKGANVRPEIREKWRALAGEVAKLSTQLDKAAAAFAFSFVEGTLVSAIRKGHWVLLDEINLASSETLEALSGLFEGGSLTLTERGDVEAVARHPNFKVFACMNPPTDIGKKDLPPGIRNRFTEFYVDDLDNRADLALVVKTLLAELTNAPPVDDIVDFYMAAKREALTRLLDGANQKPHFSLRTLSRALHHTRAVSQQYGFARALYEGINMSFLTQINRQSYPIMEGLIKQYIKKGDVKLFSKSLSKPSDRHIQIEHFWVEVGDMEPIVPPHYILTQSIRANLNNLARILVNRKHPILLQGPTSSGKTSMVEYLAQRTGHRFIRINNHEHTDLQEYLGQYVSDDKGKLVFQEGILVEAVRKGYWVVLDELNLAPSEVLEALNRLLDDNRELYIPETQEIVRPHPSFMLFATQNPPGLYGGRKVLSRAFRNRFLELHVDDIPENELEEILAKRCALPPSYCKKLVAIMRELQLNRQGAAQVFAGKHGFITFRDLFRWAQRNPSSYDELGAAGYMLLAERLRKDDEKAVIRQVIERHLKIKIDLDALYNCTITKEHARLVEMLAGELPASIGALERIVWTASMRRLFSLVGRCLEHKEPILLVGETGCKTADFLGGLRPVRGREAILAKIDEIVLEFSAIQPLELAEGATPVEALAAATAAVKSADEATRELLAAPMASLEVACAQAAALFAWVDGPLVTAMKEGHYFLVDEISLAEDAVLERLNSVLEPARLLVLAEKGGAAAIDELRGHENFRILATMNPGGDFGKKELSPAMRNRFTEIWVPAITARADLLQIVEERLAPAAVSLAGPMLDFVEYLSAVQRNKRTIGLRDILAWVAFINKTMESPRNLSPASAYVHGACLVLLDGFGMGANSSSEADGVRLRSASLIRLLENVPASDAERASLNHHFIEMREAPTPVTSCDGQFGMSPFFIPRRGEVPANLQFSMAAPTTSRNAVRVLRGMQLPRAILIEGSPGVGKTSLVTAIAKASGHKVVRINLSEQTDIMDLLGADLPREGGTGGQFEWRDGVFLKALRDGSWVLLDELNLASQTVLEGLNACLDHRAEVYIPELGKTYACHPDFRVFAAQNPLHQGGGRKGLPKSFLNRFTQVFVDALDANDLCFITAAMYPQVDPELLTRMVEFNATLHRDAMVLGKFGRRGSPWEFNLRDIFRWCDLVVADSAVANSDTPILSNFGKFVDTIYLQRMRTEEDRQYIRDVYSRMFPDNPIDFTASKAPHYSVTPVAVQVGHALIRRSEGVSPISTSARMLMLQRLLNPIEALMTCVRMNWMSIVIGPTASSKTTAIRMLAQMTGNTLYEFSMNSAVDTTELLGGFEQMDLVRHQTRATADARALIDAITIDILTLIPTIGSSPCVSAIRDIHEAWAILTTRANLVARNAESQRSAPGGADSEALAILGHILVALSRAITQFSLSAQYTTSIEDISARIERIKTADASKTTGCFEWIDGLLIKALETGAWLVIDNANFCNPTVLDRLNPLLEAGGVLTLNERGMVDGDIKTIIPHPNFRMFLTMDERKGEISRAMRNRGIEVYMPADPTPDPTSHDSARMLAAAGVASAPLAAAMANFHADMHTRIGSTVENPLTIAHLLYWARLSIDQLQRGSGLLAALRVAMQQIYVRPRRQVAQRDIVSRRFNQLFATPSALESMLFNDNQTIRARGLHPTADTPFTDSLALSIARDSVLLTDLHLAIESHRLASQIALKPSHLVLSSTIYLSLPAKLVSSLVYGGDKTLSTTPALNTRLATLALHAALFFIEGTNATTHQSRAQWLTQNTHVSEPSTDAYVEAMRVIFVHPVYVKFANSLAELLASVGLDAAYMAFQGHQLKNNEPLFSLLSERAASTPERAAKFAEIVQTMDLLKIILRHTVQSSRHDAVYASAAAAPLSSVSRLAPVVQSFLCLKKRLTKDALPSPVVAYLYPFFKSLGDQLSSWFSAVASRDSTTKLPLAHLEHLVRLTDNFWSSLADPACPFSTGEFVIRWRWMAKDLIKIGEVSLFGLSSNINALIERINAALGDDLAQSANRLWKRGGHPLVMRTERMAALDAQFAALTKRLAFSHASSESPLTHPLALVDTTWKQTFVEALSTLHWINQQQHDSDTKDEVSPSSTTTKGESLLPSLEQVVEALGTKLTALTPARVIIEDDKDMEEEHHHFDVAALRHTAPALWPMYEHSANLLQGAIVARIVQIMVPANLDVIKGVLEPTVAPAFEALLPDIQEYVRMALDHVACDPAHIAPFQTLIWLIQGALAANPPVASVGIVEMHSILHAILYNWNASLWNASYNQLSHVERPPVPSYKLKLATGPSPAELASVGRPTDALALSSGPPRLFQSVQSIVSFYLTCDWHFVSVVEMPGKVAQLDALTSHILAQRPEAAAAAISHEWAQYVALFAATMATFTKAYSPDHGTALLTQLAQVEQAVRTGTNIPAALLAHVSTSLVASSDSTLNSRLATLIVPCIALIARRFEANTSSLMDQAMLGKFALCVACFRLLALVPAHPVDPTAKYAVAMEYASQLATQIDDELEVRREIERLDTGRQTNLVISELEVQREAHAKVLARHAKRITLRPTPPLFDSLHRDISQFAAAFAAPERIVELLSQFDRGSSKNEVNVLLATESMWQEKAANFVTSISSKYMGRYRDVAAPLATAVLQMKYGLRLVADAARRAADTAIAQELAPGITSHMERVLASLVRFPRDLSGDHHTAMLLLAPDTFEGVRGLLALADSGETATRNFRVIALLLRAALCQLFGHVAGTRHLDTDSLVAIDGVFRTFIVEYNRQEEARIAAEAAAAETVKFRTKSHKMETLEEKDEKTFLESFPNFYKDFEDLEVTEHMPTMDDDDAPAEEDGSDDPAVIFDQVISPEEIQQICLIHKVLFEQMDGIALPVDAAPLAFDSDDRISLFQLAYECGHTLLSVLKQRAPAAFDHTASGAHLLAATLLRARLTEAPPALVVYSKLDRTFKFIKSISSLSTGRVINSQKKLYNIYTDANTSEINIVREPLTVLKARAMELLIEFDEHPVLVLLGKLVDRILDCPATDPLIKIVTGLELIMRKGMEWEAFAHKGITLKTHLAQVARIVTRWRKLEIESWPTVFQAQERAHETKARAAWFSMYALINDLPSQAVRDDPELLTMHIEKMYTTVQEYMYLSTFGDLQTRLGLLASFARQLDASVVLGEPEAASYRVRLSTVVRNVQRYFANFLPAFETKLAELVAPIESKAVDFIRLARWEDNKLLTQYELLKQHIEKSHRTLAKLTIKYRKLLAKPIHKIFVEMDGNQLDLVPSTVTPVAKPTKKSKGAMPAQKIDTIADYVATKGSRYLAGTPATLAAVDWTAIPENIRVAFKLDDAELHQNKLPMLFARMTKITRTHLLESQAAKFVAEGVEAIDELATDMIDRVAVLAGDNIKRQEKQLALYSLLDRLGDLGVTYRASQYPQAQLQIAYLFQVSSVGSTHLPARCASTNGAGVIESADSYYYRIVSRVNRLRQHAVEVSPDMTPRDVQKMTGYVENMLNSIIVQRAEIQSQITHWETLDAFARISAFSEPIAMRQHVARTWLQRQQAHFNAMAELTAELHLLATKLKSLPQSLSSTLVAITHTSNALKASIDAYLAQHRVLHPHIEHGIPLATESTFTMLANNIETLKTLIESATSADITGFSVLQLPIETIIKSSNTLVTEWTRDMNDAPEVTSSNEDIQAFTEHFDAIVKSVLLAIQNKKALANSIEKEEKLDENKEDEEEEEELIYEVRDGHIGKLQAYLSKQVTMLHMADINSHLKSIHNLMARDTFGQQEMHVADQMMKQLYPVLKTLLAIANQSMVDLFAFHKTLSKLEYIISGVFIQLYTKGYCKKGEESAEQQGEGTGNLEDDVEGTGMGEGEGKKDVSDQIDDKEQLMGLEDDKPEEKDSDEENEEKDKDEGFDMTDDFEGEMHDIKEKPENEQDDTKKDEEEEEPEKEMGDLEKPEDNVVDEKLWGEEDQQDEEEQKEDGKGEETNSDEMMGKDEEDPKKKKKEKEEEKKDDAAEEKQEKENPNQDDDNEDEEEEDSEDDLAGQLGDDEVTNEEDPDNEENHMDPRQEDQFEIPEDLDFGGEDEEEGDQGEDPMPEDPLDIDQQDDDFDGQDKEMEEDEEEGEDGEDKEDEDKEGEDEDENQQELDGENQGAELDHVEPENDEEAEDKKDEEATSLTANEQDQKNDADSEQPLGVKDKTGIKSNMANEDNEKQEEEKETQGDDNGESMPAPDDDPSNQSLKNMRNPNSKQQAKKEQQKPPKVDPNPYRSLGDVQKEWQKRLKMLNDEEQVEEVNQEDKAPKGDDNAQEDDAQEYQFKADDKDDKDKDADQALGAATESQLQDMPQKEGDGEDEDNNEADEMEVDQEMQEIQHREDPNEDKKDQEDDKKKKISSLSKMPMMEKKVKDDEKDKDKQKDKDEQDGDSIENSIDVDVIDKTKENISMEGIKDTDVDMEDDANEPEDDEVDKKKLTRQDLDAMREELEKWKIDNANDVDCGAELWKRFEHLTNDLSQELCEQLRLILEPTLATKLQGDYKTGKRINMKKVIPYIASQFKKDKIWLRRTKPNKRQYQVMLAIDDTESMDIYHSGQFALEAMTMISRAMARLEVGQLGIVRFGADVNLVHPFDQPFSDQCGANVITQFNFKQEKTDMVTFLAKTIQIMEMNKQQQSQADAVQLLFIVSDGWSIRDPEGTKKWLREASNKNIFIVFIVIDNPINNNSILEFESISFVNGKIQRSNYMNEFPFPYYVILRSLDNLPQILGDTLRQWFEMIKHIE